MNKSAILMFLLVAGVVVGIVYSIRQAGTNEPDWEEFNKVKLGHTLSSVKARFGPPLGEYVSVSDARSFGFGSEYREVVEQEGYLLLVIRTGSDDFLFGFNRDQRLVYRNFKRN
jgi:hypothetical protein